MPTYMFTGSYTTTGRAGLSKEGGSARADAVGALLAGLGGSLDSMHFRFGSDDFVILAEMPDDAAAAAASLIVSATGTVSPEVVPLITPAEMDQASKLCASFRPPGA